MDSCATGPPVAIFATTTRPANVTGEFLKGKVGVLRASYKPIYLIGAYRMLSGKQLTEAEVEALYSERPSDDPFMARSGGQPEISTWEARRQGLAGDARSHVALQPFKSIIRNGYVSSFLNCGPDAFDTASATLSELRQQWGTDDLRLVSWVLAQDQVFSNCSGTEANIPAAPGTDMDPLLAAHRRYQIAAAQFYSGQFRTAAAGFLAIGKDEDSPWEGIGAYLAARSLVRAGDFLEGPPAYREAMTLLERALQNPRLQQFHDASQGLLNMLRLRVDPEAGMAELGAELMSPPANEEVTSEHIAQTATDFVFLIERTADRNGKRFAQADYLKLEAASELAAWVRTMLQGDALGRGERAVGWWRKTRNPAWLVAALSSGPDLELAELLAAASKIGPGSPAFESVAYYAVVREAKRGRLEEARRWADRALASRNLTRSGRNLILTERTKVARNWEEFLRYSLRRLENATTDRDGRETPGEAIPLPDGTMFGFDNDVITAFNSSVPLHLWINASGNPALPAYLQLRVAQSGWIRAVMLGRYEEARTLLRRVVELNPGATEGAKGFLSASSSDPEQLRFAAIYLYLRAPGLAPDLRDALVENENLVTPHVNRMCPWDRAVSSKGDLRFLTLQDRQAGKAEDRALTAAEQWQATLTLREVLAWAARHPDDSRVPEALHRAVMRSFYGCKDEETRKYSEMAYRLLHTKFAGTRWAAETKYWYR